MSNIGHPEGGGDIPPRVDHVEVPAFSAVVEDPRTVEEAAYESGDQPLDDASLGVFLDPHAEDLADPDKVARAQAIIQRLQEAWGTLADQTASTSSSEAEAPSTTAETQAEAEPSHDQPDPVILELIARTGTMPVSWGLDHIYPYGVYAVYAEAYERYKEAHGESPAYSWQHPPEFLDSSVELVEPDPEHAAKAAEMNDADLAWAMARMLDSSAYERTLPGYLQMGAWDFIPLPKTPALVDVFNQLLDPKRRVSRMVDPQYWDAQLSNPKVVAYVREFHTRLRKLWGPEPGMEG